MRNLAPFTAIVALGNLGVTIWHLGLARELNPALSFAQAARIGTITIMLTLCGVILLWLQRSLLGSLVLLAVFAIGLVIGSLEHFFISGPNNVFDAGVGGVAFLLLKPMVPFPDGVASCSRCGHVVKTLDLNFRCTCPKCRELNRPLRAS
jgi:Zn finger protein HypA/HybF involved in hydrogenase expression